jgi:hypothetical protein
MNDNHDCKYYYSSYTIVNYSYSLEIYAEILLRYFTMDTLIFKNMKSYSAHINSFIYSTKYRLYLDICYLVL